MEGGTDQGRALVGVFTRSYDEVLAALKHQDEKLNRTLTALAFLTVAGVALFPKVRGDGAMRFEGSTLEVPAVFFVVFIFAVTLAVISALTAIGPGSPLRAIRTPKERAGLRSLIFYAHISRDLDWDDRVDASPGELQMELARNLHNEAREIAWRVDYKVARARESGAWVQLAIVSLALMGIFGTGALSESARWWTATGLISAMLVLPFWDLREMILYKFHRGPVPHESYWLLGTATTAAVVFLILGEVDGHHWEALTYALFVFVASRLAVIRAQEGYFLLGACLVAAVATMVIMLI